MSIYTCPYTYVYMCIYLYTHANMSIYTCLYTHVYIVTYMSGYALTHIPSRARIKCTHLNPP